MTAHAKFAPSSMGRTVPCPGSVSMCDGLTDEESDATREGEATHWVGECILTGDNSAHNIGDTAPNGVVIGQDMVDAASLYVSDIISITDVAEVNVELPVAMPQIHRECWGTPDAWHWSDRTRTLYLWDLKYGHLSVLADGNWQLAAYLLGILNQIFGTDRAMNIPGIKIVATIVQPRCYDGQGPFRRWELTAEELRPYVNVMELACAASLKPDPMCNSGSHCRVCLARHHCPAAQTSAAMAVDYSTLAVPHHLTGIGIDYELTVLDTAIDRLTMRKKALEAEAEARINRNEVVPGRALQEKFSNKQWLQPVDNIATMGDLFNVDLRAPTKLITPTQAIALLKKNAIDESVIKDYIGRKSTGMKLVIDDCSRANAVFGTGEI